MNDDDREIKHKNVAIISSALAHKASLHMRFSQASLERRQYWIVDCLLFCAPDSTI
jgi:hypothetical protein